MKIDLDVHLKEALAKNDNTEFIMKQSYLM
jgi:hypothetical protein